MLTALVSKKILITGYALRLKGTNVHSVRIGNAETCAATTAEICGPFLLHPMDPMTSLMCCAATEAAGLTTTY